MLAPSSPLHIHIRWTLWTLLALLFAIAWDALDQDRALASWWGNASGFALREHWFLVRVMHEGGRLLGWLGVLLLVLSVWWPASVLKAITPNERLQIAISALLSLGVVILIKNASKTSCPWDLADFGGAARYASHWALGVADGGGGRCFPAGHASAGFAFVGGYFALHRKAPRAAKRWLAGALVAGLVLGLGQQMRGAHFMSHTLWTGWLCWATGWLCDAGFNAMRQRHASTTHIEAT